MLQNSVNNNTEQIIDENDDNEFLNNNDNFISNVNNLEIDLQIISEKNSNENIKD